MNSKQERKFLEIKKMKQGMSYSGKEKTIILNVFKYFHAQFPDKCVTELIRKTAAATGCSEKSIFQFRKEESSGNGFKEPPKRKIRKNININSRVYKYDNTVRCSIKTIIYDLKYKNIMPSLNKILQIVNNDGTLPNFSLMTLRRLLSDMGFYYKKDGTKSILVERGQADEKVETSPVKEPESESHHPHHAMDTHGCTPTKQPYEMPHQPVTTQHLYQNVGFPPSNHWYQNSHISSHRMLPMPLPPPSAGHIHNQAAPTFFNHRISQSQGVPVMASSDNFGMHNKRDSNIIIEHTPYPIRHSVIM